MQQDVVRTTFIIHHSRFEILKDFYLKDILTLTVKVSRLPCREKLFQDTVVLAIAKN